MLFLYKNAYEYTRRLLRIGIFFFIRKQKIILDFHLSLLYEVENLSLKQQLRRNKDRFPEGFMFEFSKNEWNELITNCDMHGQFKFSPTVPMAFTEQGVAMLSSVLKVKKPFL